MLIHVFHCLYLCCSISLEERFLYISGKGGLKNLISEGKGRENVVFCFIKALGMKGGMQKQDIKFGILPWWWNCSSLVKGFFPNTFPFFFSSFSFNSISLQWIINFILGHLNFWISTIFRGGGLNFWWGKVPQMGFRPESTSFVHS